MFRCAACGRKAGVRKCKHGVYTCRRCCPAPRLGNRLRLKKAEDAKP